MVFTSPWQQNTAGTKRLPLPSLPCWRCCLWVHGHELVVVGYFGFGLLLSPGIRSPGLPPNAVDVRGLILRAQLRKGMKLGPLMWRMSKGLGWSDNNEGFDAAVQDKCLTMSNSRTTRTSGTVEVDGWKCPGPNGFDHGPLQAFSMEHPHHSHIWLKTGRTAANPTPPQKNINQASPNWKCSWRASSP